MMISLRYQVCENCLAFSKRYDGLRGELTYPQVRNQRRAQIDRKDSVLLILLSALFFAYRSGLVCDHKRILHTILFSYVIGGDCS